MDTRIQTNIEGRTDACMVAGKMERWKEARFLYKRITFNE
jgi:hypothetical protein